MRAAVGVVIEFPEMYKLIDRPGIALEIADKLFILPALLERREADLLVELHRLCHLADMQRVGSQFVQRHGSFPFHWRQSLAALIICHDSAVVHYLSPSSGLSWGQYPGQCLGNGKSADRAPPAITKVPVLNNPLAGQSYTSAEVNNEKQGTSGDDKRRYNPRSPELRGHVQRHPQVRL
jgi:hypothetical protein